MRHATEVVARALIHAFRVALAGRVVPRKFGMSHGGHAQQDQHGQQPQDTLSTKGRNTKHRLVRGLHEIGRILVRPRRCSSEIQRRLRRYDLDPDDAALLANPF